MVEMIVLRLVHVLGGIFWVGAGVFSTLFLMPALGGSPEAAGQVMAGLQRRKLYLIMPSVALLTVLSGTRLLWIVSGGLAPAYFATARGATFGVSALVTIVAFLLAVFVLRPAGARMGAMQAGLRSEADETARAALGVELERYRIRSARLGSIAMWLLILGSAGMAVARYLG